MPIGISVFQPASTRHSKPSNIHLRNQDISSMTVPQDTFVQTRFGSTTATPEIVEHGKLVTFQPGQQEDESQRWETLAYEVKPGVTLRTYNGIKEGKPPILFLTGYGNTPFGSDPFAELGRGNEAPGTIYSLDRPYQKGGRLDFRTNAIMDDTQAALDYLYALNGHQAIPVIGFSLGGLIAARLAVNSDGNKDKISKLALLSPAFHSESTLNEALKTYPGFEDEYSQLAAEPRKLARSIHETNIPTALYIGEKEAETQVDQGLLWGIGNRIGSPGSEYKVIPNERHRITNTRLDQLITWLNLPVPKGSL